MNRNRLNRDPNRHGGYNVSAEFSDGIGYVPNAERRGPSMGGRAVELNKRRDGLDTEYQRVLGAMASVLADSGEPDEKPRPAEAEDDEIINFPLDKKDDYNLAA
ncbi:MAG TPA: hypothetical protein VLA77_03625 [Candidatus Saccharimonadales bacterium]|nr:hypothetical protein [Candidatus Saccharimonadales bacterium]